MRHVVMFSGGIASWATARRVADQHGTADLTLLFTDTLAEDADLYRFLDDAAAEIGVPVTRVADGRTPWEVFHDERRLGSNQVAPCSKILKQRVARRWLTDNADPSETMVYVGIDWTETHRLPGIVRGHEPWRVSAPLCEPPLMDKAALLDLASRRGLIPPRLYAMGFPHNNCGGVCVRAGHAQWAHLLRVMPERYAEAERNEQAMRDHLGKDVAILRDRTGGTTRPMTLAEFRRRQEQGAPTDALDWAGCGCFTNFEQASA